MPKPSSNLFRCEPERLDLPLGANTETALISVRSQFMQGGLVNGSPTILIVFDPGMATESRARVYAHELRAALDILEPARPKRVRTRTKTNSPAAQEVLNRVVTKRDEHHG